MGTSKILENYRKCRRTRNYTRISHNRYIWKTTMPFKKIQKSDNMRPDLILKSALYLIDSVKMKKHCKNLAFSKKQLQNTSKKQNQHTEDRDGKKDFWCPLKPLEIKISAKYILLDL